MPPASAVAQKKSLRILLAEDDRINQRLTRHLLNRFGYNLEIVSNGREALEATRQKEFDVILMDCFMPELDGYDCTRQIRRQSSNPGARSGEARWPYIIAMTAQALQGDREKCMEAGMDDYIPKPIDPESLLNALLHAESLFETQAKAA